jgi:FtsP/CotA-like multicopper oxidase with cupredoxin domain
MKRREMLKAGLAAGGAGLISSRWSVGQDSRLQYLCPPDGTPPQLEAAPSPPSRPFAGPLNVLPVKQPAAAPLNPPPDPAAHQLWDKYPPKKFYTFYEQEFRWVYHPDPPYAAGSWGWGFDGITPGPTFHARYGEPILVRRFNSLPNVGNSKVTFALPSTSTHLHNGHTASESDGNPQDWIDSGEFWDHHYCCFPSGNIAEEKLSTLWYHDHRMDFTASNVYAGLSGFFLLFDEQDSGDENDPNSAAWRLPSGPFDVPLMLHDVVFDQSGQVVFDPFNTDGILGDKYTVNRKIQPFFRVQRRKYRFRITNGGPSRFYQLFLRNRNRDVNFIVLTGDGNVLTQPIEAHSVYLSVAQRVDVIIDFAQFDSGEQVFLQNRLLQTNGKGPTERMMDPGPNDSMMRFDVTGDRIPDPSRIPARMRNLPKMDLSKVRRRRTWVFDYNGGLWTVNGQVFNPNRVDAKIEQGTAEIWTLRNQGKNWSHPIHSHFTEFLLMEVNGVPLTPISDAYIANRLPTGQPPPDSHPEIDVIETSRRDQHPYFKPVSPQQEKVVADVFMGGRRRDIATLNPSDELVVYMKWDDFLGKHVMHCHNVVHEDHSMMIRWDIVPPGQGDSNQLEQEVTKDRILSQDVIPHLQERPRSATQEEGTQKPKPKAAPPKAALKAKK